MAGALLLVDVVKDFLHEDGDALHASFRERHPRLVAAIAAARSRGEPVVYANDVPGTWDSDGPTLVRKAVAEGKAGDLVEAVAPQAADTFVLKPRYSAFDATPLSTILHDLGVEHLTIAGTATEMCVFQTAMDALRHGFSVGVQADACATVDPENERLALDYLERVLGVEIVRA